MPRKTKKTEDEKTIPEMAEDVARVEMSLMYKDGKLTAEGRRGREGGWPTVSRQEGGMRGKSRIFRVLK
ncbi:MAG: hypothetical protein J6Y19_05130 [Kiritimatiellae bacterium]|nr:hypothetical protein [Kiritimatiellia bacterium]